MRLVTAAEMRELDRLTIEKYGTPGRVLMERAGTGAARIVVDRFGLRRNSRVVILAGKGNNGGDGFVIARFLRRRGVRTEVFLCAKEGEVQGDAKQNLQTYVRGKGKLIQVTDRDGVETFKRSLEKAEIAVDALFGTGLDKAVRGVAADLIETLNGSELPVVSVDIPSGLNADTGQPMGTCVRAHLTTTFEFPKLGMVLYPGYEICGDVEVVKIGIAPQALEEVASNHEMLDVATMASLVPWRHPESHKGDFGHVLVIAGSFGKTGAARLVTYGALRAGAGLVTTVAPASLYSIYAANAREAMTEVLPDREGRVVFDETQLRELLRGKNVVVIGPGVGTHDDVLRIVQWLLGRRDLSLVLDADALTCVARNLDCLRGAAARVVLTPHPGEMARLAGTDKDRVQRDRVAAARAFASRYPCTLVLKGAHTIIAEGGRIAINATGNPGMASGGMGDALAGILGGLLAQGLSPWSAARLGVFVHAITGDAIAAGRGEIGMLASDVIAAVPSTLEVLSRRAGAKRPAFAKGDDGTNGNDSEPFQ